MYRLRPDISVTKENQEFLYDSFKIIQPLTILNNPLGVSMKIKESEIVRLIVWVGQWIMDMDLTLGQMQKVHNLWKTICIKQKII